MIWRPDTCQCKIDFNGDWSNPVFSDFQKCQYHSSIIDDIQCWQQVYLGENKKKNDTEKLVKEVSPDKEYIWSFDAQRKLVVDMTNYTKAEKDAINLKI